jgi:hypothetical protein
VEATLTGLTGADCNEKCKKLLSRNVDFGENRIVGQQRRWHHPNPIPCPNVAVMPTYRLIHFTNIVLLQELAGFIRVANIFKGFGSILGTFIEKNFFTTGVLDRSALINELFPIRRLL